jgi:hypothetical protein
MSEYYLYYLYVFDIVYLVGLIKEYIDPKSKEWVTFKKSMIQINFSRRSPNLEFKGPFYGWSLGETNVKRYKTQCPFELYTGPGTTKSAGESMFD